MDGVIVDNHIFHYKSWQAICEKYGKPLTEEGYKNNLNGRTLTEVVKFIFEEEMPLERVREIGNEKEEMYRELYAPHLKATAGIESFLQTCKEAKISMAVGTSAPVENVDFTLDGLGFRSYFSAILDERAVTKGKPNPEIYMKCAKALDIANQNCIVFEDAVSGIKAGQAAGSKVIALATSHEREELSADLIVNDFTEVNLNLINELLGK